MCYYISMGGETKHFDFGNLLKHISQHSNSLAVSITRKHQYYGSNALVDLTWSQLTLQPDWCIIKLKHATISQQSVEYLHNNMRKICADDVVNYIEKHVCHFIKLFHDKLGINASEKN